MRRKRTTDAPRFYVGQAFHKLSINDRALLRSVLIVRIGELGDDRDHTAGCSEFELLPALKTSLTEDRRRNHKRRFVVVFDSDGHSDSYRLNATSLHLYDSRCMLRYL